MNVQQTRQLRVMIGGVVALTASLVLALAAVAETPGASATAPGPGASTPPGLAVEGDVMSGTIDSTGATWTVRAPRLTGPLDPAVLETIDAILATGQRLALADLFSPGVDYLDAIATESRRSLLERYATDRSSRQWVKDGTQPSETNYSGWALTPDGLEITFGQYQVAPYAEGMPVVVIGWSRLAGLLDPAGPAALFLDGSGLPTPLPEPSMSPSAA